MFNRSFNFAILLSCFALYVTAAAVRASNHIVTRAVSDMSIQLMGRQSTGSDDSLFGPLDLDSLLGECTDDCTPFVQKVNDTQCLLDTKCICTNEFGSMINKCYKCALGTVSDANERAADTKNAQEGADKIVSECKNAGNEISAIKIDDSGNAGAAFQYQAPTIFLLMSIITFALLL
jgi:hypothetical protein